MANIERIKPDNCDCQGCSAERRVLAGLAELDTAIMPRPDPNSQRREDDREVEARKRAWMEYRGAYIHAMSRYIIGCMNMVYRVSP